MTDAGDKDNTSQETQTQQSQGNSNSKVESELQKVQAMLDQMNQGFAAMTAANVQKSKQVAQDEEIDPVYDSKRYTQRLREEAKEIARMTVAQERELNAVVYQMSQDFPEIATDANLKKAITDIQRTLPENIRETALGYEAAILKATNKAGLVPKSKRQADLDEDVSVGSGRGSSSSSSQARSKAKGKLPQETLDFAALLGRDINDPKVIAGLEAAAKRDKWSKFE